MTPGYPGWESGGITVTTSQNNEHDSDDCSRPQISYSLQRSQCAFLSHTNEIRKGDATLTNEFRSFICLSPACDMSKVIDNYLALAIAMIQSRVASYIFEHIIARNTPAWFKFFWLFWQGLAGISRAIAENAVPAIANVVVNCYSNG